jgi:hypothetical protein
MIRREQIEEPFGWIKTVDGFASPSTMAGTWLNGASSSRRLLTVSFESPRFWEPRDKSAWSIEMAHHEQISNIRSIGPKTPPEYRSIIRPRSKQWKFSIQMTVFRHLLVRRRLLNAPRMVRTSSAAPSCRLIWIPVAVR